MYLSPSELRKRKYCSRVCQSAAIARDNQRTCLRCGEAFQWRSGIVGKYCSSVCYRAARQGCEVCQLCGQPLAANQLRYCSHPCRDAAKVTIEQRPCEQCGTLMQVEFHLRDTKRFCSRACLTQSKRLTGPGARMKRHDGYIQVYHPTHPDTTRAGMMLEHRLVAEQKYGRRILPTEHVHHLNGVRDDNRPENLEVIDPSSHAGVSTRMGVAKRKALRDRLAEYEKRFGPLE